jgi:hypothetical protein
LRYNSTPESIEGMNRALKHLLVWVVTIGILFVALHFLQGSGVHQSAQVANGSEVTGANKGGWFSAHPYFFSIGVLVAYIPLRVFLFKKRTANRQNSGNGVTDSSPTTPRNLP